MRKTVGVLDIVTLDVMEREHSLGDSASVNARFGGVGFNVARTLLQRDVSVSFISLQYKGDIGKMLESYTTMIGLRKITIPVEMPMPFYLASLLPDGSLANERFVANGSLVGFSSQNLASILEELQADYLVTCTGMPLDSIDCFRRYCFNRKASLWLIVSCLDDVITLKAIKGDVAFVSINNAELCRLASRQVTELSDIAKLVQAHLAHVQVVLVTLGSRGAALFLRDENRCYYQPVLELRTQYYVAAGDVLVGNLLAGCINGNNWSEALRYASKACRRFLIENIPDRFEARQEYETDEIPEMIIMDGSSPYMQR